MLSVCAGANFAGFTAGLALMLCVPGLSVAQQAGPDPGGQGTAAEVVLHANANLVLLDVAVTRKGEVVHGLKQDQFKLMENGKAQRITTFEEHTRVVKPMADGQQPAIALPAGTYTNQPDLTYSPDTTPAVNVLLLDALNTPMADQMQVRRQMLAYLKRIPAGPHLAIFTLASRLSMVLGFTTDAGLLARAIGEAKNGPKNSVFLDPQTDSLLASTTAGMSPNGTGNPAASPLDPIGAMNQFEADETAYQTDQRVAMTMSAMQQLARFLAAIPGRKNLIWFSGSFPIELLADDSLPDAAQAQRNYSDALLETDTLLAAARVAVYPVDARGLMTPGIYDASYDPSTNLMGPISRATGKRGSGRTAGSAMGNGGANLNKAMQDANQQMLAEQGSMQQIAAETGGHAFLNGNDLAGALSRAVEDGENYYTVGYALDAARLDGKFHKLGVKIEGGNYDLAYRPGFYAGDPEKAKGHSGSALGVASMKGSASIHGAPAATQIVFQLRVAPVGDAAPRKAVETPDQNEAAATKGPTRRYAIDFRVHAQDVTFVRTADGGGSAQLEYTVTSFDAEGKEIDVADSGFRMSLKPAQFEMAMKGGLPLSTGMDLPLGRIFLRMAIHDLLSDRIGSLEVPITVQAVAAR